MWGGGCVSSHKMLEFYSLKCDILVHFISIRSNHYLWPSAHWGRGPLTAPSPLNTRLDVDSVQYRLDTDTGHRLGVVITQ